jgi:hypothetical protein
MALLKATLAEEMLFSHLEASELDMLFKAMHVDGFLFELDSAVAVVTLICEKPWH